MDLFCFTLPGYTKRRNAHFSFSYKDPLKAKLRIHSYRDFLHKPHQENLMLTQAFAPPQVSTASFGASRASAITTIGSQVLR